MLLRDAYAARFFLREWNLSGETILVVDDEQKIVRTVRTYLENAGFRVVTADDGQLALTVSRHEEPALVILDLGLPGLAQMKRKFRPVAMSPVWTAAW